MISFKNYNFFELFWTFFFFIISSLGRVLELIVSEESKKLISNTIPRSEFKINYRVDCSNLCSDFRYKLLSNLTQTHTKTIQPYNFSRWILREDISFHFSLGFTALMRRFSGNKSFSSSLFSASSFYHNHQQQHTMPNGMMEKKDLQSNSINHNSNASNLNPFGAMQTTNTNNDFSSSNNMLLVLQGMQMIASKSNVVLIAVSGIVSFWVFFRTPQKLGLYFDIQSYLIHWNIKVWRGLGWKILAITASLYGLCYLYERLMWTRKTQEKLFKKQYADYASSKLRLIVDLTSQNAAGQVQQYEDYFIFEP